jgi:mannose-6-phosphate isomerase
MGIALLKNRIQGYAWGSPTFLPSMMGDTSPGRDPKAELWMGVHPNGPSMVLKGDRWLPLAQVIGEDPFGILGVPVARRFGNELPFLFKVLAVAKPLSLQAHPNVKQALEGYEREEGLRIRSTSPHRSYKDRNHKPEALCALTPFWALKGFRSGREIAALVERMGASTLWRTLSPLRRALDAGGLKEAFGSLFTGSVKEQKDAVTEAVALSRELRLSDPAFEWITRLDQEYPGDIGALSPLFLNLVHLEPGQAVHILPGELHSYLEGAGIELMANSDNVLRGGLTSKHVDVPALMDILDFTGSTVSLVHPQRLENGELLYRAPSEEFVLSMISLHRDFSFPSSRKRNVEILLCTAGLAEIADLGSGESIPMPQGTSVLVPASVEQYTLEGDGTVYKASVPLP